MVLARADDRLRAGGARLRIALAVVQSEDAVALLEREDAPHALVDALEVDGALLDLLADEVNVLVVERGIPAIRQPVRLEQDVHACVEDLLGDVGGVLRGIRGALHQVR